MAGFIVPLITAGISAATGFLGNKPKVTTTDTSNNSTSTSNPNLSSLQQQLLNTAGFAALKRVNDGPADMSGIIGSGLDSINQSSKARQLAISNIIKSRGLSFSPNAGFVQAQEEGNRTNQQDSFLQQIPTLQRSMQDEDLKNLLATFGPTGSTTTSSSTGKNTSTGPDQSSAGLLGGLGAGLFSSSSPGGGSNLSSILKSIGIGGGS